MNDLFMWEYEGKTEFGWKHWERTSLSLYVARDSSVSPIRDISEVTNLRKVKVVFEELAKGDNARPCLGCQCEPNQVTKDAIEEARNRNDTR